MDAYVGTAPGRDLITRYRGIGRPVADYVDVTYGASAMLYAGAGDLMTLTNIEGAAEAWVTALCDDVRNLSPEVLDIAGTDFCTIEPERFDHRSLAALLSARDTSIADGKICRLFDADSPAGERFVFRAKADCRLILIAPLSGDGIAQVQGGRFRLEIQRAESNSAIILPEPLAAIQEEWRVERATAHAYRVKKGQLIQIIDVEGQQCSDFMAMRQSALDEGIERYIDATTSRTMDHSAYPQPGLFDKFYDQDIRPLLAVRQDTVGRHDTFALACTARGYEERGFPGHINCSDNISQAYQPYGIQPRRAWPAINFFFNSNIHPADNQLTSDEAWSRPGDYVLLQALDDLVCVSTACPDDIDPINGWNPTDIHVRIYNETQTIMHAVSYRAAPEDSASMTKHSAFHPRTAALTSRFAVARDLWLPSVFDASGTTAEYWACKNAATIQDMSSLRKFDIVGPDAETLLQYCMSRNVAKLAEHRGLYALICDQRGAVIDDGTLFRLGRDLFRWCCGSENSGLHLREQAEMRKLRVWIKSLGDEMPNLAVQGPKSREILNAITFTQPTRPALENLKWFGFTIARLQDRDGAPFMITRTGFTGELGYEIFCAKQDALAIWDGVMAAGEAHGLMAMGSEALDMLRIEAGLMVSGAEFTAEADALEAGLGFAVDWKKGDFHGRSALARNAGAMRKKLVGLAFRSNDPVHHGDHVYSGRAQVGVVTSATRSAALGHTIAMARIAVEDAAPDTVLEVGQLDGQSKRLPCRVTAIPFIDPKREKPRA